METLRLSVTDIDALRRYRADEEAELETFLRDLRREDGPTPSMIAGTALHKALEFATPGEFGTLSADGHTFDMQCDGEVEIADIRETKGTMDITVDGCVVTLVGKVDALHGRRVDDHKFTTRYDGERFMDSWQWRCYLAIFNADEFRWNIFEARETDPKSYVVNHLHRLTMYRYPGMMDDVVREVGEFVRFAREHLPERIGRTAA